MIKALIAVGFLRNAALISTNSLDLKTYYESQGYLEDDICLDIPVDKPGLYVWTGNCVDPGEYSGTVFKVEPEELNYLLNMKPS